jgi:ferric-chelate reductase
MSSHPSSHARRSLANQDKAAVRRIVFIWAIRDIGHADWIAPALHAAILAAPRRLEISTHVHATNMSPAAFVDFRDDESTLSPCGAGYKEKAASLSSVDVSRPFSVAPGRPDVARLIGDELELAAGSVSVDVCGPGELATAVRQATRFAGAGPAGVLRGRAPVTLHVEKFGM